MSSAREMSTAFTSSVTVHFHHHLNSQGHFALSLFFSSVTFDRIGHVLLEISFSPQDSASSSPFPRMSPSWSPDLSPPHQGRHLPETRSFIINDVFRTRWPQGTAFFSVFHLPLPPWTSPPSESLLLLLISPTPGDVLFGRLLDVSIQRTHWYLPLKVEKFNLILSLPSPQPLDVLISIYDPKRWNLCRGSPQSPP